MMLVYGLITGVVFGFLLQKGRVLRYDRQVGALRLTDMTIVKFMMSGILVGVAGMYLLRDMGAIAFSVKPLNLGGNVAGGLVFGMGWAVLGYCPGTQAGALGEGRWDAVFGILGMLCGAAAFAEAYPFLKKTVLLWGDYGKITLPQMLNIHHWIIIPLFAVGVMCLFAWFEKRGL